MDVSTFEILFKPLTPSGGSTAVAAVGRRVLTGYFLTVVNREAVDLTYRIEYHVTTPITPDPNRTLDGVLFIVDAGTGGGTSDNVFAVLGPADRVGHVYRRTFRVRAGKAASVTLVPNVTAPGLFNQPAPTIEARGWVSLHLPGLPDRFERSGTPPRIRFVRGGPQSATDVTVLLNAELRSTYLPNDFRPTGIGSAGIPSELDFDQTAATLMLASGMGRNTLQPEPGLPLLFDRLQLDALPMPDLSLPQRLPAERLLDAAAVIGELAQRPGELAEFERFLGEVGIAARVGPREPDGKRGGVAPPPGMPSPVGR